MQWHPTAGIWNNFSNNLLAIHPEKGAIIPKLDHFERDLVLVRIYWISFPPLSMVMHWLCRMYQRPMSVHVYFFSGMLVIGNVIIIGWLVYFLLLLLRHLQNVFFRTWCDWCLSPKNYFWNSTFPLRKFSDYNWGGAGMAIQHWIMTHEVWPFICWKNHHIHNTLLGRRIAHRQPTSRHHVICTVNQACIIALGIVGCWKLITS